MNTSFTPGPWTFYNPDDQRPMTARGNPSDRRIMVLHPDKERLIACCNTGTTNKLGSIPREERLANARLIAQSPALLESLQEIYDAMIRYEGDVDGEAPSEHHRMMNKARAAINLATGQEP